MGIYAFRAASLTSQNALTPSRPLFMQKEHGVLKAHHPLLNSAHQRTQFLAWWKEQLPKNERRHLPQLLHSKCVAPVGVMLWKWEVGRWPEHWGQLPPGRETLAY